MQSSYFPKWVGDAGRLWGILAIVVSLLAFPSRTMPIYIYIFYLVEILGFFYYCRHYSRLWAGYSVKRFIKTIFWIGVLLRVPWTLYTHYHYVNLYGPHYFNSLVDLCVYVGLAYDAVNDIFTRGDWGFLNLFLMCVEFDDIGAPIFNMILLLLTGNSQPCLVPLMANIIMGAYTSIFVYRIARRHFGEEVARMTALFCMLNPNLIWWCSSLMKEVQMTFFTFWYLDRMDAIIFNRKISVIEVAPVSLIGSFVFLYRAALGILLFVAFFATVVLISNRVVNMGKKLLAGALVAIVLLLGFGEQMREQTQSLYSQVKRGGQKENMEWRSERDKGNSFARYAGAAVFAPLIFTIPFPTVTYTHETQEMLMEVSGGNFIKNILSFFVILCLFIMLFSGEWRRHVFLLSFLIGYLIILVMSQYAQSGRFHVPVLPVEMMFAAYSIYYIDQGKNIPISVSKRARYKRWYHIWCIAMFAACIFWQWFKLRGQGLI